MAHNLQKRLAAASDLLRHLIGEAADTISKLEKESAQAARQELNAVAAPDILHIKDVIKKVGLCRTVIFEMTRDENSDFPRPISLSPSGKRKGFLRTEIEAWLERRAAERDGPGLTAAPAPARADPVQIEQPVAAASQPHAQRRGRRKSRNIERNREMYRLREMGVPYSRIGSRYDITGAAVRAAIATLGSEKGGVL